MPRLSPLRNTQHWPTVGRGQCSLTYPSLCFNVGAHVNEVAGNACAAIVGGLVQKCEILPTTRWHGLLGTRPECQTPYIVIAVLLLEQRCALIVWRVVDDSLDRLQVAIVSDLCIQLQKDTKQANEMAQESIQR